uniref:Uncharacterized protein n=1 Tax=Pithovirus LCDPAC01 TaxID=2506600 RepID=A0A481YNL0_9VIRU|nr:MAG: hypothetical protein LCDPAC01_01770 [Pithovirus LCDPAC01]
MEERAQMHTEEKNLKIVNKFVSGQARKIVLDQLFGLV